MAGAPPEDLANPARGGVPRERSRILAFSVAHPRGVRRWEREAEVLMADPDDIRTLIELAKRSVSTMMRHPVRRFSVGRRSSFSGSSRAARDLAVDRKGRHSRS